MKKLNLFLACAAVAVASMFGLSSCDKEDNPGNGGGSEDVVKTYDYQVFVSNEIFEEGDIFINVVKNGKPTEYNLKDGTAKTHTFGKDAGLTEPKDVKGKEMVFTNLKKGDTAEAKFVVKEGGLAAGGTTYVALVACPITYKNGGSGYKADKNEFYMGNMLNEKVQDYIDKRFAASKFVAE